MKVEEKFILMIAFALIIPVVIDVLTRVKHLVNLFIKTLFSKDTGYESDTQ